jgi:hypothetical protein
VLAHAGGAVEGLLQALLQRGGGAALGLEAGLVVLAEVGDGGGFGLC